MMMIAISQYLLARLVRDGDSAVFRLRREEDREAGGVVVVAGEPRALEAGAAAVTAGDARGRLDGVVSSCVVSLILVRFLFAACPTPIRKHKL